MNTRRLILRQWQEADIEPFIELNQDTKVMEFFPKCYSKDDTINSINLFKTQFNHFGYGPYAIELKENQQFIGYVGLMHRDFDLHFSPCIEIGWRLSHKYWGQGLAVEAANKCFEIGFNQSNLNEIVSFTAKINYRSERVMQKLGMLRDINNDFYHPKLDNNHKLAPHILYRLSRDKWFQNR
jgi:RimJ/RimL family protein N-acetyltransferase